MRRTSVIFSLAMLLAGAAGAARGQAPGDAAADTSGRQTLAELASRADLVALVQVRDTDYVYTRGFPTGGTAYLGVLIAWKLTRPAGNIVAVYEEGLHPNECYFDNPTVFEEGRRYLVFLRDNPEVEGQYLGLGAGCSLDVLVTADNRYALRYPPAGIDVADDLSSLARPVTFADAYAVVGDDDLPVPERNALLAGGHLEELDAGRYRYTHGVELGALRPLLGEDNIKLQRTMR